MFFVFILMYLRTSSALLLSTRDRVSTRNITCQNGSSSSNLLFNCEVCLVISRNYEIRTTLSLTGSGPLGVTYACLQVNQIEAYHENLVRECNNFPQGTLNGYDDFCVASPYNKLRGSYRACMCITNACNLNYSECVQRTKPYWDQKPPTFSNSIVSLTNRIKCYRPYEDYKPQQYSSLTPLCSSNDYECKDFLFDQGILCVISVDRTNQITRQTLPPSIYSAHLMKYKSTFCKSYTWTSKSIYFTQCQQDETICMCAVDGCDKDLETCRKSRATSICHYSFFYFLLLVLNIYF
ncbi:unnamed protein product [Adineta steineri]|uniref:Uncharacterized protein n=1 Tax=Adineta steineri TaxID=433720 RepID=A0A815MJU0_9BILA|nr:unnamed protein product [Adineta steineri]CAF1420501.1 unnamed protein product [Adineta steineri]CAF1426066.1 unnamed protein product [Adineta steineri]